MLTYRCIFAGIWALLPHVIALASGPSITIGATSYAFDGTILTTLPIEGQSLAITGQINGDAFQVQTPLLDRVVLSCDSIYLRATQTHYVQGFFSSVLSPSAAEAKYWINAFSNSNDFIILTSDTLQTNVLVVLQVYDLSLSTYFWKTVVCSPNVTYVITTWYTDPNENCLKEHNSLVQSLKIQSGP